MERKIPFVTGEFYHLYNRGVDKRTIFTSAADYKRFLMLLYLCNSDEDVRVANVLRTVPYEEIFSQIRGKQLVSIGAFCLMPNHFHILATPLKDGGIPRFMLKLQTGYSMYFNTKYERNGSLFQGPFKSVHTVTDVQLHYLYSYIHLNPAKLKDAKWRDTINYKNSLIPFVESYPYSSYGAYLDNKHTITNPKEFPDYFSSKKEVQDHITEWFYQTEQG